MSAAPSVKDILGEHVVLEIEGIDRLYLNGYVPKLQIVEGVVGFFRRHRGDAFASSALMEPITARFVESLEQFALAEDIPLITFRKGERKDDVAAEIRKSFDRDEGVYFIGKAQEKARIYRTEKRRQPSVVSGLNAWVKVLQVDASVVGLELPVDMAAGCVALILPCVNFAAVSASEMRRFKHCTVRARNSISAMLSQLPCLGVWWISSLVAIRLASSGGNAL
jgi:hypothetical protein